MLLDQEILGLEEKKKVGSEVCKTYNKELVTFTKVAGEQTYVTSETFTYKRKRSKAKMWGTWTRNKEPWWGFGYTV